MSRSLKLKKLVIPKQHTVLAAKPSIGRTLRVNHTMRIIADDAYLKGIEKYSLYNRVRRESDREASLEYAGTKYAK